ncbi:MAG TPA: hypothetical protein VHC70_12110 [Phycisphaerales bacterium]|nr:hypothetical protein [Phycisphaerales bacterium]
MQDSPPARWIARTLRAVDAQRRRQHGATRTDRRDDDVPALDDPCELPIIKQTQPVRFRHDPKRARSGPTRIDVDPDREERFEHIQRRPAMMFAVFDRPEGVSASLHALGKRNRRILMPRHHPVGLFGFVEQQRPHDAAVASADRFDQLGERRVAKQLADARLAKQNPPDARRALCAARDQWINQPNKFRGLFSIKKGIDDLDSARTKILQICEMHRWLAGRARIKQSDHAG